MKARLAAGETLFGTFLTLGSPFAAESLGLLGWDWLLVDLEHGGGDESQLVGQLMGCSSAGVHALVRVESDVRGRTARALDLGVEGVMCPQVNSAEQAEAWASALHYGPQGSRGIALFHRGARYGTDPDAIENARERIFGIAQIESPEAVEAVEEIAAVDGIDVLFVGPSDLSYSMGMFRQFDDPAFRDAIERVNDGGARRRQDHRDLPHRRRPGAGRAGGRVPDDRPRLRRRLHDGRRARHARARRGTASDKVAGI